VAYVLFRRILTKIIKQLNLKLNMVIFRLYLNPTSMKRFF
jgi:hypothetical protein